MNSKRPEFEILSYADSELAPKDFNKTPSMAIHKALAMAGLDIKDVDFFEINEVRKFTMIFNIQIDIMYSEVCISEKSELSVFM